MATLEPVPLPEGDRDSRRGVLKLLSTGLGALVAAVAALPVLGAALSPLLQPKRKDAGGFLPAIRLADLPLNVPKRVELVSTVIDGWTRADGVVGAVWLIRTGEREVRALSTICPHSGCSINLSTTNTFACPCHTSAFSLEGTPLSGPSPRPMDPLSVEIRGDDRMVYVRYARFKQGTPTREEI